MPPATTPPRTVIFRADGLVDQVDGGAPSTWVGHALRDVPDAPSALADQADALLALPPAASGLRLRSLVVDGTPYELVLLESLPLRRTAVDVHDLLLRTLDVFLTQARTSAVDIKLESANDLPATLFADGEKVAWVLATLVGNALRAFEPGRTRGAHIVLRARYDGAARVLALSVDDNGRGMPEARSRWLFERDPSSGRSAGLALAMVRDVALAHRGRVTVESTVGVGTCITLLLPLLEGASHA